MIVDDLTARLRPIEREANAAWWEANTDASPEADRRRTELELALREVLSDSDAFASVQGALADAGDSDGLTRRQLVLLRNRMRANQVPPELRRRIVELETDVEGRYATHRGEIDGERVNDNQIAEILATSDDVDRRRRAWEASKSVGAAVSEAVLDLVRLRNEAARALGAANWYELALAGNELDRDRLFATLDELESATTEPFRAWKAALDEQRAARYGCPIDELRPWHEDDVFFQEPPRSTGLDLDRLFAGADLVDLTTATYDALGLDLRAVVERSDLVPREGKSQHAFCMDVDRAGDVRVLSNNATNERWMGTMLHEFGHAAYDVGIGADLPWLLHEPAHMLTTEAIAMLFGRLVRDAAWLEAVAGLPADEAAALRIAVEDAQRGAMLVFARWVLVMTHFERGLYERPDDDHDRRWWDLVERLQQVRRPDDRHAPDWAAKIHLAVAPVYYQNYLYGELFASQLHGALARDCGGLVGRTEAGRWLTERVFRPGASLRWDRLVEQATGEPLRAGHFITQFVSSRPG
ncbi:MAG: hypothetical protein JWO37_3977 [Acidimicrobiales bacterium]|jgi:peptidyl-dipeptidase A|nr:hypothetical protein [Acidimicrobiales bacterium]